MQHNCGNHLLLLLLLLVAGVGGDIGVGVVDFGGGNERSAGVALALRIVLGDVALASIGLGAVRR